MSLSKDYLREYAQKELELLGFMETEFGKTCLKFLEDLADIAGSDPKSMKLVCEMLPILIDRRPLSPITKEDFEQSNTGDSHYDEIKRCTRYPYCYGKDGKYFDDRAVAFRFEGEETTSKMYLYRSDHSSRKEVSLPYLPRETIKEI